MGGGPTSRGKAPGGPGVRRVAEAEPDLLSSPLTSARPFTFRFSAVFRREDSLSWSEAFTDQQDKLLP
jgi:hypothetical protein